ncbi:hypothetical protein VCRA2128O305_20258 [Vibrio crassostreae]|uniref:hypothetical protein n=1 Tax=Vibrio crassostreae TaxID=246167 RepID=UPI0005E524A4|nr:hypothetical protein [Vibrio crassostreae]TCT64292.1 hypothetical protein EDB44_105122 [Vibrio crassostreae]TCT84528.1 hypothetical protein EDB43_105122 [Vibrio crassostreae]TCU05809.1 hypothetical protein EDB47_105203 [Vibrio crassostreae]TDW12976.1 hypothetical protein EDB45_102333 [Vibrio crassostreae]CAK1847808.1 hypothetical protein VCRA2110O173_10247 [Vibrio crassostreae]
MFDEKLDRLKRKVMRLKQQEADLRRKEEKFSLRLKKMDEKMRKQNERFFTQWFALTFTCFDYAWLSFMYPGMTIRKASTLLNQPKSTLHDRVKSIFVKYDVWERHLVPLAKQGSYHFIRIVYAYELIRSDYEMSVREFCNIYALSYNTVRAQINRYDAENVLTHANHFYLLYTSTENTTPMRQTYTRFDVTEKVLNIFTKRHSLPMNI